MHKEFKASLIESSRLIFEPLSTAHVSENYVSWLNDPEVFKYLETGGNLTVPLLQEFLEGVEKKNILFWAIILKEGNKHIGNIKIDPVNNRHGLGEYGILIGDKSEWGKGFAKEASLAVINFCFNDINLRKITLGVVKDNIGAYTLYKNLGFLEEGIYKNHGYYEGKYCDVVRMALFNPNYKNDK